MAVLCLQHTLYVSAFDLNLFVSICVLLVQRPVFACCRSATDRQQGTHVDTLTEAQLALMQHALMTQQSYARTGIKWRCAQCCKCSCSSHLHVAYTRA
jgi:hypothetical protein